MAKIKLHNWLNQGQTVKLSINDGVHPGELWTFDSTVQIVSSYFPPLLWLKISIRLPGALASGTTAVSVPNCNFL